MIKPADQKRYGWSCFICLVLFISRLLSLVATFNITKIILVSKTTFHLDPVAVSCIRLNVHNNEGIKWFAQHSISVQLSPNTGQKMWPELRNNCQTVSASVSVRAGHERRNTARYLDPYTHTHRRTHRGRHSCCWCAKVMWLGRVSALFDFPVANAQVYFASRSGKAVLTLPARRLDVCFQASGGTICSEYKSCQVSFCTAAPTVPTERMPRERHVVQMFVFQSVWSAWSQAKQSCCIGAYWIETFLVCLNFLS